MNTDNSRTNDITRRKMLKYAGTGVAAGILSSSLGKAFSSTLPGTDYTESTFSFKGKTSISLIIDKDSFHLQRGYKKHSDSAWNG
jgi:hypothetical protein